MDNQQVKFKRIVGKTTAGSLIITIPKECAEFLGINKEDNIIITAEVKTKGKFLALWKEE